jgi:hypothetical protein
LSVDGEKDERKRSGTGMNANAERR